ncbi:phage tail tape measure protein [Streptomyces sp. ME02-6991-2B]|nr:phage tail tape measure protein [Streptomyces sp. ME02-6991-2B]
MALTVGELAATITVDDSGAQSGIRDAERAMRAGGDRIVDIGEQAGEDAGQGIGDGVTDGAEGGSRGAIGALSGIAKGFAASAVGAAIGGALMAGMADAMEQEKIAGRLGAQLGATPEEARRYGKLAGRLYADAVTEDFQGAADTISAVMRAGIAPPDATNAQIQSIATNVSDLASTFDLDLGQTANAVGQILKTGLAKDGKHAVDALTRGLQKMGPRADDIADTFNEYSTIFRQMGLSATDATGLLSQGLKAGARDTDVVADSLKEFVLITQGGGKQVDKAFAAIGLSGKEMQKAFIEGGPKAREALDDVFDGLRKIKDPAERNALALQLFGTKAEDTQKALLSLDPSEATDALGKVGGAADEMGDSLRDNASTKIEQFKRSMQQNLVDFLGGTVLPAVESFKDRFAATWGGIWDEASKGNGDAADKILAVFKIVGARIVDKLKEIAPQSISAIIGWGESIANYIIANPGKVFKLTAIASALVIAIATLPILIAAALSASAAVMMLGFGKALVTSLIANVPKWWGALTNWVSEKAGEAGFMLAVLGLAIGHWFGSLWSTYIAGPVSRVWAAFVANVRALPGRAVAALATLGSSLATSAGNALTRMRTAAASRAATFVADMRALPRRIASAVGSLGSLLYSKGQSVVTGLWNGIRSMGGWLRSTLIGWARSVIPGPIADALGIHSPSRVMADEVGRWIPAGVAQGIDDHAGIVDRSMRNLVDVPTPGAAGAARMAAVSATSAGAAGSAGGGRVVLDVTGADGDMKRLIRRMVRVDGRGSVQTAFGT